MDLLAQAMDPKLSRRCEGGLAEIPRQKRWDLGRMGFSLPAFDTISFSDSMVTETASKYTRANEEGNATNVRGVCGGFVERIDGLWRRV